MKYLVLPTLLFLNLVTSCSRAPLKHSEDAMRPTKSNPEVVDTLSRESFFSTLRKHIDVMKTSSLIADPMIFGNKKIDKKYYISSLEEIFNHPEDWLSWIENNFEFYEVYGKDDWGEVMSTGYYEPKVMGAKNKTSTFSRAIYSVPSDLVSVDLKNFSTKFSKGEKLGMLQGRLVDQVLLPYFDRKSIDVDQKLSNQKLELAWVDPIDAFFIQIQGSGVVEFSDGTKTRFGYAGQNGHSYFAIGRFLTDVIPMEDMSMQKIKKHLQSLSPEEQQIILNKNPSYVFFRELKGDALTYAGMEVSDGRTIATDLHFFPKGAMAFLDIEEPVFENASDIVPSSWKKLPRIVFDQDTGGAIKGGGRVDLYFGQGESASQKAGVMKQKGRLYYLVPRTL